MRRVLILPAGPPDDLELAEDLDRIRTTVARAIAVALDTYGHAVAAIDADDPARDLLLEAATAARDLTVEEARAEATAAAESARTVAADRAQAAYDAMIDAAWAASCTEVAHGMPAALAEILGDVELPYVYDEPDPEPPDEPDPGPPATLAELAADLALDDLPTAVADALRSTIAALDDAIAAVRAGRPDTVTAAGVTVDVPPRGNPPAKAK